MSSAVSPPRPPCTRDLATKQRGLRRALVFAVISSLVVPGIAAGLIMIYLNLQQTIASDARARSEKLTDLLQAGLERPLWDMAPDSAEPLIAAIAADPSVIAIDVTDPAQKTVLSHRNDAAPGAEPIVVSRTIRHNGERLGEITLRYSTQAATDEAWRASWRLAVIIAIQLLASLALLGLWLSRRVLRPLRTLGESAERIAGGDLQTPVASFGCDEFGNLAERLDSMRQTLAESVDSLEEQVEERTYALKAVNARLQSTLGELQRMQSHLVQAEKLASLGSLVAGVAHELNTPIGTGVTVVSTICDKCVELRRQIDAGIRRSQLDAMLDDIAQAGALAQSALQRAARLVHDFKQVAVDQTSARRREFRLRETLEEMMAAVKLRHKHAPVRFEIDIPADIALDSYPGALEQVLTNLIDNAVIHGAAGRPSCTIAISGEILDRSARIVVADDGNGIAAANLARIFDPFYTTRLGTGGSGLGLSIAYNLVTGILGGHIRVESNPGEGTRFSMELPVIAPEQRSDLKQADRSDAMPTKPPSR